MLIIHNFYRLTYCVSLETQSNKATKTGNGQETTSH